MQCPKPKVCTLHSLLHVMRTLTCSCGPATPAARPWAAACRACRRPALACGGKVRQQVGQLKASFLCSWHTAATADITH